MQSILGSQSPVTTSGAYPPRPHLAKSRHTWRESWQNRLAGAAVDVFEQEPPPPDHPLLHMNNVIVTPHCTATAYENSRRSVAHWLGNIERVSRGEPVPEVDRVA